MHNLVVLQSGHLMKQPKATDLNSMALEVSKSTVSMASKY